MIPRRIEQQIRDRLRHMPGVVLLGPRQIGKTTLAREIAENTAPVSVALSRQMMWRMLGASHPMEAHRAESRGILQRGKSPDAREGVMSFLEKRAANFTMKVSTDTPNLFPEWQDPEFR